MIFTCPVLESPCPRISYKVCFDVRLELCKMFPLLALGGIFCCLHNMCTLALRQLSQKNTKCFYTAWPCMHYRYVGLKEHKYRDFKSISHSEEFWIIFVASNIVVSLMSSLQLFDTPKFLLFLNKKIERILRTSDLWQKLCCGIGKSFESIRKCVVPENAHTPPTEGMGNSWGWRGGGSQRSKLLGNVWSVHVIGISRGMERGSLRINPFHGNGMDNLWNYTIWYFGHYFHCRDNTCQSITTPNIWIFFSMQE